MNDTGRTSLFNLYSSALFNFFNERIHLHYLYNSLKYVVSPYVGDCPFHASPSTEYYVEFIKH